MQTLSPKDIFSVHQFSVAVKIVLINYAMLCYAMEKQLMENAIL